jgi:voltage-gated potassium channel
MKPAERGERRRVLRDLEAWLEKPLAVLGLVWLALLGLELARGLSPALETATSLIWAVFIADFLLRLLLAPRKRVFLRRNWLTALSLVVPALRFARAFAGLRGARVLGRVRLVKVVGSLNRGMRALGKVLKRRRFGYVVAFTTVVTLVGAAGMYAFEREAPGSGMQSYWTALWWTAMVMTTLGSEHWPQTGEGRVLCFLLSLYAFSVFGYVTATLATWFVGRDAEDAEGELAGERSVAALRQEIAGLRREVRRALRGR